MRARLAALLRRLADWLAPRPATEVRIVLDGKAIHETLLKYKRGRGEGLGLG